MRNPAAGITQWARHQRMEERRARATTLHATAIGNEEPQEQPMLRRTVDLYPLHYGALVAAVFDTMYIPEAGRIIPQQGKEGKVIIWAIWGGANGSGGVPIPSRFVTLCRP